MRLASNLISAFLIAIPAITWLGCAEKITNDQTDQFNVAIRASAGESAAASPQADSYRYRLRVTARDMETIDTLLEIENGWVVGRIEVPAGLARRFTLTAEDWVITFPITHVGAADTSITVVFRGEKTVDVIPGQNVRLNISMRPVVPMIKMSPKYSNVDGGAVIDLDITAFNLPGLYDISLDFELNWDMVDPIEMIRGADLDDRVNFSGGIVEGIYLYAADSSTTNPQPIVNDRGDVKLATFRVKTRVTAGESPVDLPLIYPRYINAYAVDTSGVSGPINETIVADTAYFSVAAVPDMVVTFPDPELDNALRYWINASDTATLMLSYLLQEVTYFDAGETGISDLTNLNLLANLEQLYLGYNNISDITPLSALTNLRELSLAYDPIGSVQALAPLVLLEYLQLNACGISDLTPLRNMTLMESLNLSDNSIVSIAALSGMTRLYNLNLSYNQITDISPLVDNPGLGQYDAVDLRNNPLSETSVSVYLPQLRARGVTVQYE